MQLGWTFILLGATLAYAVQNRHQYRRPGETFSPQHQLQLAFDILQVVYANFARKKRTTFVKLNATLKEEQPGDILATADALVRGGLLLRTSSHQPVYLPAAPAEALEAGDVVRQVLGGTTILSPGGQLAETAIRAAAEAITRAAFPLLPRTSNDSAQTLAKEANSEKAL